MPMIAAVITERLYVVKRSYSLTKESVCIYASKTYQRSC